MKKAVNGFVLDGKRHPPRVICRCRGWNTPKNAALIVAALEAHHSELHSKFPLDGSGRPAVKPGLPSSEAEEHLRNPHQSLVTRTNRKVRQDDPGLRRSDQILFKLLTAAIDGS